MAEAIVGPLLNKLQEVVVTEGKALAGVGREIDRLRGKLMWLQALVHETDLRGRSDGNKQIQVLACQMREVAFEAEDAVDRFFLEVDLSRFGRQWRRAARLFLANFAMQLRVRFVLSRKIISMNTRLEDIVDNSAKYSSSNFGTSTGAITWRASRSLPPLRRNWENIELQEPNTTEKENQSEHEEGNRSATKSKGKSLTEEPESKKTPTKKGKKKTPTKGESSAQGKQTEQGKLDQQAKLEETASEKKELEEAEKQKAEGKLARKAKIADLKDLLLDKNEEVKGSFVIYVVGESGIGKKHLIKKTCKDATIKENFEVFVWASFPPDTSDIADQIKRMLKEKCSKQQPGKNLCQVKYLAVVDCPMRSNAMLGSIIEQSLVRKAGSKIVVTATSIPPGRIGGIIKLAHLDKAKSKKVFNDTIGLGGRRKSAYKTEMMNKVRDPIEEITNGLPLAVILLGKLMRTMDYNKWEGASKYIMNNNQDDLLRTIVSMGIDDLPDEPKSCLLYMAGFPERSTMDAVQLVRLWKAEGFLTQQFGVEPEELGQRYLKELIFRGLVELVKKTEDEEAVESVEIRDQIYPFFRWEAQRTGFMETQYGGSAPVPHSTRRLALNSRKLPKLEEMKVLKKLRTLLSRSDDAQTQTITTGPFIGNERVGPIGSANHDAKCQDPFKKVFPKLLRHSIFLRVIDLEDVDIGEKLPRHIGELLHLRHLGVRCSTLRKVPGTIGNLKRLQILDVRRTQVRSLPDALWTIKSLRRVLVDNDDFFPDIAEHLKDSA